MLSAEAKNTTLNRLKRIEGQIRGIQRLIEEDCDCRQVMHQVIAARSAMNGMAANLLEEFGRACMEQPEKYGDPQEVLTEMSAMLRSLIK